MKLRTGFVLGFGAGYYLGAKAGRQRYEQINQAIEKLKGTEVYETATSKAKEAVDVGVERAKHLVDSRTGGNGSSKIEVEVDIDRPEPPYTVP